MDYGANFEEWRRQQEAAQAAAIEQQRIQAEQQRAAQVAAAQQAQQQAAMQEIARAQQAQQERMNQIQQAQANQPIPSLQAQSMQQMPIQQAQQTPNYAEMAKAIGLPWSPNDADYAQQINDYNARMQGMRQSAAERQATTEALRQQIAQNPEILEMGKQNLAKDKQLNTLADQLNAFYAKQNNTQQDEAQKAYTTAVLRTQIAQNPELYANALKQFSSNSGGRRKKASTQRAQGEAQREEQRGDYYSPSYVTENPTMPLGDLLRTDRAAVDELKKKIVQ